jgi:outer membrane protein assembly factor BamB
MSANKGRKLFLASIITCLLLMGVIIGAVYTVFTSHNANVANVTPLEIIPGFNDEPTEPTTVPIGSVEYSRGKGAGELLWSRQLTSTPAEAMLSAPALCDLNPPASGAGKKFLEIVVGCTDDHVYAVDKDGKEKWTFSDCVIDDAITATSHISLDFDPAPYFSSITPVDIAGGKAPELLMGEQDGVLAITPDGSTHWTDKGTTDITLVIEMILKSF